MATGEMTSRWFRPRNWKLLALSMTQNGNNIWRPFAEGFDVRLRVRMVDSATSTAMLDDEFSLMMGC